MTAVARAVEGMPGDAPPIPDPPAIEGLRFRCLHRPDDYEALADLSNRVAEFDGVPEHHTAEEMANWLERDPGRDLARDFVAVEAAGELIASAMAGWEEDTDGGYDYATWGVVAPAWRRRGIGTALLHWVEARQRQVAKGHAADVPKRLESWSYAQEEGRTALLERNGYTAIRFWFEMQRPNLDAIPDAPLPPGFTFVPPQHADPREVWDVVVTAFQDHFGAMDTSEAGYQRHLADPNRDPSLWVLVAHDGRIVGTALNRINHSENEHLGVERGRVNAVAVLREFRRQGLGRAITAQSLRVLRDAGMRSATLGVDAENPHGALKIYESLGFAVSDRGRIYRKPLAD